MRTIFFCCCSNPTNTRSPWRHGISKAKLGWTYEARTWQLSLGLWWRRATTRAPETKWKAFWSDWKLEEDRWELVHEGNHSKLNVIPHVSMPSHSFDLLTRSNARFGRSVLPSSIWSNPSGEHSIQLLTNGSKRIAKCILLTANNIIFIDIWSRFIRYSVRPCLRRCDVGFSRWIRRRWRRCWTSKRDEVSSVGITPVNYKTKLLITCYLTRGVWFFELKTGLHFYHGLWAHLMQCLQASFNYVWASGNQVKSGVQNDRGPKSAPAETLQNSWNELLGKIWQRNYNRDTQMTKMGSTL